MHKPHTTHKPLLEIQGLTSGYGKSVVLRDISITVAEGEVVGIIGPNGHGKSTFLNTISGFVKASSGSIRLRGQPTVGRAPELIVSSGIVQIPQGDQVFPELTVKENLLIGGYLVATNELRQELLNEVHRIFPKLEERQDQLASTLSGGERRMLAIGRGMMVRSDILMIDEPSLGLAPIVIDQIYDVLRLLKNQGRTIIVVEENPSRVEEFADSIYLIDNGLVVWSGTPGELRGSDDILETYLGG